MDVNRGSEWRRWEMHMHTPFTQKADQFTGSTPDDKWDNFYRTINDYVGDGTDPLKAISAIAITDYYSIKNYLKVLADNRLPDCVELLLPNIELRMIPIAKEAPINIHCVFSPKTVDQIQERFLSKLKFRYHDNDYGASYPELVRFGRAFTGDATIPESQAYQIGLAQYTISCETLSEIFTDNKDLRDNTIIIVSNKSGDGASGVVAHSGYFEGDASQLDATRQQIYQLSDMIFSANQSDIDYFLGQRSDDVDTVKHKCGSLMPCVHGCDAHSNIKIFEPDNKRYCWIKADPTFEGLKQVLYEPKERVWIGPSHPDTKQGYHVIDRVEIIGNTDFSTQPIYFNDKLTCIIGGKSTGKSLLLHNIAYAIDAEQVKNKEETASTNVKQIPQMRVFWRDGACSDDKDKPRKIVYIPQTYLNRLSDEKEETTEIDSIIQDIVLQDEGAHQLYTTMNDNISAHKQVVAKTVVDFLQTISERNTIINAQKEIGDKSGIANEIAHQSAQLDQLSREYNVTEDEIKTYQTAVEKVGQLAVDIKALTKEKEQIGAIDSVLQKRDLSQKVISQFADDVLNAVNAIQTTADSQWVVERTQIIALIDARIIESQKSLSEYQAQVENLKPKMEGNEQISKVSAAIVSEKEKLGRLEKLDTELHGNQKVYDSQMAILTGAFETYKGFYATYVDGVNEGFAAPTEDLEFHVERVFRSDIFSQKLLEILHNKSLGRFPGLDFSKISEHDLLDHTKMQSFIEALIINSTDTLQLKTAHSLESALRDIFADWNNVDYIVTMDGDSIEDMSPGKKALVLLRLLISLAESKCPILIDQPEDDLDNRSIFDELIQFIKAKKVDRQIIAATHNANIVLGGDAELVLVANQQGKNSPNQEFRFEYRGGSIEDNLPVADGNGNVQAGILNEKGIQTHICEILEGGERAFDLRKNKYRFIKP